MFVEYTIDTKNELFQAAIDGKFDELTNIFESCLNELILLDKEFTIRVKASKSCILGHWGELANTYPEMMKSLRNKMSCLLKQFENSHNFLYWEYYVFLCKISYQELECINYFIVCDKKNKKLAEEIYKHSSVSMLLRMLVDNNCLNTLKDYIHLTENLYSLFFLSFDFKITTENKFIEQVTRLLNVYKMTNDNKEIDYIFKELKKDMLEKNTMEIFEKIQLIYLSNK